MFKPVYSFSLIPIVELQFLKDSIKETSKNYINENNGTRSPTPLHTQCLVWRSAHYITSLLKNILEYTKVVVVTFLQINISLYIGKAFL